MRTLFSLMSAILASAALPAIAADNIPTLDLSPYLVGQAPAGMGATPPTTAPAPAGIQKAASTGVEKASAINGQLYAVIAPTYYSGGTLSFIRLFSGAGTTFTVTLVGNKSGATYGTASIPVPANASLQLPLNITGGSPNLQTLANAAAPSGQDTSYALYIQAPDQTAGYQHAIYNAANTFLENDTNCANLLSPTMVTLSNAEVLINVHTSSLPMWPSTITLSNYWNGPVNYRLTVRDAKTGLPVGTTVGAGLSQGQFLVNAAANSTYVIPESQIESILGFTPTASQYHLNIFIVDTSGAQPNAVTGQAIINTTYNAEFSMSTACAVNAVQSTLGGTGGSGLSGY